MNLSGTLYPYTSGLMSLKKNKDNCIIHDRKTGLDLVANHDFFDILNLCNGNKTINQICSYLSKKKKINLNFISKEVISLFLDIKKKGLINFSKSPKNVSIRIRKDNSEYPLNYTYLEITKRCNFSCIHCYAKCPTINKSLSYKKEMDIKEYYNLIDTLDDMGVMFIHITGGEPFIRDDIFDLLSYIASKNIGFSILTNGSLLNEKKINKLKKLLPRSILISFDSNNKTIFEEIRGKNNYDKVLKNIEKCIEKKLRIRVSAVLFEGINNSYNQLKSHFIFLKNKGLKTNNIAFDEFIPQGEGEDKTFLRVNERKTMNYLKQICNEVFSANSELTTTNSIKNLTSNTFCGLGVEMLYINCEGDILPCPGLSDNEYKIGNIFSHNLRNLWQNNNTFNYFREKKYLNNSKCNNCEKLEDCIGGCKARSKIMFKQYSAEDPWMCAYYEK
jgi:radical SAM protein with 4Fe4S-binding SPASM domain